MFKPFRIKCNNILFKKIVTLYFSFFYCISLQEQIIIYAIVFSIYWNTNNFRCINNVYISEVYYTIHYLFNIII